MKAYVKPELQFLNNEAEGVYMASGSQPAGTSVSYDLRQTSEGNPYYKVNAYAVIVHNNSEERVEKWSVTLQATSGTIKGVTSYNGYVATASVNGNTVIVSSAGEGGALAAGESKEASIAVEYSSESLTIA